MSIFDDIVGGVAGAIGGILGGGGLGGLLGGGGSDLNVKIEGGAPIKTETKLEGGAPIKTESDSTTTTKLEGGAPIKTEADTSTTTKLEGGAPIHTKTELVLPQPFRTETKSESRNELAVTEPIVTQMSSTLDVKPVVLDLCLTLGIGKLPRACIRRPYDRHFGLSVMGREVVGFDWSGDSSFVIDDLPPRSHLELGGSDGVHHGRYHAPPRPDPIVVGDLASGGGLSLRLE